jgi:hypothetical protein
MNPDGSYDHQQPDGEPAVATQETLMRKTRASLDADDPVESLTAEFPTDTAIFVDTPGQETGNPDG